MSNTTDDKNTRARAIIAEFWDEPVKMWEALDALESEYCDE